MFILSNWEAIIIFRWWGVWVKWRGWDKFCLPWANFSLSKLYKQSNLCLFEICLAILSFLRSINSQTNLNALERALVHLFQERFVYFVLCFCLSSDPMSLLTVPIFEGVHPDITSYAIYCVWTHSTLLEGAHPSGLVYVCDSFLVWNCAQKKHT